MFVTVTVQVIVSPPMEPVLLHWLIAPLPAPRGAALVGSLTVALLESAALTTT